MQKIGTASKRTVNALIIIDVQNCFINGELALSNSPAKQKGEDVIPVINNLLKTVPFDVVVYTHDWHPPDHISFFKNLKHRQGYVKHGSKLPNGPFDKVHYIGPVVETEQVLWPNHCIQNTSDAALHRDLIVTKNNSIHVYKGTHRDIDSYSAFRDNNRVTETKLNIELKQRNVTNIYVSGLATDYCVAFTALDAKDYGYRTYLVEDACRGVDSVSIKNQLDSMKRHGIDIIQSSQVLKMINTGTTKQLNFCMAVFCCLLVLLLDKHTYI
ncbi:unnamed protein product [Didymodactylos carnosus]|uniref:nicotinamidase n=2 Tax=Didymodactylos carnosus TaxID=1234261 RepID=A0A813PIY5_9BILA|nr:unnamed protein product [Didymodactylos carnosus]CAF3535049.1 unnamed protein product [Didymodactylos carnosus]